MAASQKQIAEQLGVSIALVSRVLSGKATEIGIAPDTIDRVIKAAKEMGYVPSAAALTLKGKATRTIGVAVYDFNDPFFGTLIKQIQKQAHEHNYSLVLAGFLNRTPDKQDLQSLHKHSIDGLIVIGTDLKADWLNGFRTLPVARIGHGNTAERSVRITVDEDQAASALLTHLRDRGKQRAVYASASLPAHQIRQEAFERTARQAGIDLSMMTSQEHDAFAAGFEIGKKTEPRTEAIICATDQVAMGALHALHDTGIKVAVTGFDDIPASEQFIPPITTIRQPLEAMVKEAFNSVTRPSDPCETTLPPQLIVRQTT